jgi:uncharacterized protein YuzE
MRLEYDPQIDAAYIYLRPAGASSEVAKTVPVDPREIEGEINLDFDRDGHLVGIEIQAASRFLDAALLSGTGGA